VWLLAKGFHLYRPGFMGHPVDSIASPSA
jgi:hypothetical protein